MPEMTHAEQRAAIERLMELNAKANRSRSWLPEFERALAKESPWLLTAALRGLEAEAVTAERDRLRDAVRAEIAERNAFIAEINSVLPPPNGLTCKERILLLTAERDRLRGLLVVHVLCGNCGQTYRYNRADDPDGSGDCGHGFGKCG